EEDRAVEADAGVGEERRAPATERRRRVRGVGGGTDERVVLVDGVERPPRRDNLAVAVQLQLGGEGSALCGATDPRLGHVCLRQLVGHPDAGRPALALLPVEMSLALAVSPLLDAK